MGGPISGPGFSLTKAGNGQLTLAGANTYNGGTFVLAGLLQVTGGSNSLNRPVQSPPAAAPWTSAARARARRALFPSRAAGPNRTLTETDASAFDAQSGNVTAVLAGDVRPEQDDLRVRSCWAAQTRIRVSRRSTAGVLQLSAPNGSLPPTSSITITGGTLDLGTQTQSTSVAISFQGGVVQNGTLVESNTAIGFDAQSGNVTAARR